MVAQMDLHVCFWWFLVYSGVILTCAVMTCADMRVVSCVCCGNILELTRSYAL